MEGSTERFLHTQWLHIAAKKMDPFQTSLKKDDMKSTWHTRLAVMSVFSVYKKI
jgi:hypothetical protein